ncbi:MAG: phosphatidylserine decarboxylase family protein [Flavobacteriales bacterium]|nr:phosphatidylserine decarboxylase family protein [Flavobacteriales bacterium]
MTIHREGLRIIAFSLILFGVLNAINLWFFREVGWLLFLIFAASAIFLLLIIQFFRLPKRKNQSSANEIVSPCDGKVVVIEEVFEPEYFSDKRIQVSIFMSPLNVHCNWVPCEGEVKYTKYHPGLYLVAWHPKSSAENERTTVVISQNEKKQILVRQIAGAVARRIICYMQKDQRVVRNQEIGFIRFGSRVDVFFPLGTNLKVKIGDKTLGNETVIASWQ